jgi:predicted peptidase
MKPIHATITTFAITALSTLAAADTAQTPQSFTAEVKLQVGYKFLLALPADYDADKAKQWPLIVFLHGSGERGDNLEALKKHGPPKLIAAGKSIPAIIASPQCPAGDLWEPHAIKGLVDALVKQHRVDRSRIYLTGLSMGGFTTWETAMEYPETFAALVPICGGAGVRFLIADRIKHIPTWIFHGAKDPVVAPEFSIKMHEVLKHLGADDVRLTMYPDAQHDSWTAAYETEELWTWLFAQSRK